MKNCILGNGQVANVIKHYIKGDVKTYDLGEWEHEENIDCNALHICIPYSEEFLGVVENAIKIFDPEYLIVHSTVRPMTTDLIEHDKKAYSPVMGRHDDDFVKNVVLYTKYITCKNEDFDDISDMFNLDMERWGSNHRELEYAKGMSTSYQFWNLIYQKIVKQDCEKHDMSFDNVYARWNRNYNAGIKMEHEEWVRPIYDYDNNPIPGGHCLCENVPLNDNFVNNFLAEWIRREGKMKMIFLGE